ncbi:hypothetical protein LTS08_008190 [Lithohypha guttulata]|uniref:uncharacterized protein n=1 Tax=Lithohypha guttulata TaxID=1690604 RepID=UPI002DDE7C9C|nr:hypothetical protein LTR51_006196 [Lithohypha guttulata]KAK5095291.1 hypothetical protein LTS08_008190 [Lithohypha guttulata]
MPPRSLSSSSTLAPPTNADTNQPPNSSTSSSPRRGDEEEPRPTHTAEIGTLKKLSVPGGTAWLGSSSGVYFVNTVRRAFSAAFAHNLENDSDTAVPASEDIITGEDAAGRSFNGSGNVAMPTRGAWWLHDQDIHRRIVAAVGRPPANQGLAMDLITTFFRQTHPLFPFLHGPRFLEDVREIYVAIHGQPSSSIGQASSRPEGSTPYSATNDRRTDSSTRVTANSALSTLGNIQSVDPLKLITFQIIINIANHSHTPSTKSDPTNSLPPSSLIPSSQSLLSLVLPLSTTPLLPTIQLLLAAELYLLTTISLRQASTLAGVTLRLIYHAGLHRCPLRYASLTEADCEIRKRIFWAAYAIDRHLSLALGDPNTFQDSDIDVCVSRGMNGEGEMHRAVARELLTEDEKEVEVKLHYARDSMGRIVHMDQWRGGLMKGTKTRKEDDQPQSRNPPTPSARSKQLREAALTAYVHYGRLTGRIIEIFHKSINFRFPKEDAIGFLTADIENWWNELPSTLTGEFNPAAAGGDGEETVEPGLVQQHKLLTPFFTLLYHQLLLLLNRPRLSLDQSTAEFQQGLQVCIRASKNTLIALKKHKENSQSVFLPGLLSAAWMAGLIIAFACQLGKYPKVRACSDIRSCLLLLESMNLKWYTVKNCHKVLTLLLASINERKAAPNGYLPACRNDQLSNAPGTSARGGSRKRNRDSTLVGNNEAEPSPKRDSLAGMSPASSDFHPPHFRSPEMQSNSTTAHQQNPSILFARQGSGISASSVDFMTPNQSSNLLYSSTVLNGDMKYSNDNTNNIQNQHRAGAAIYADPQDMAFAQSSHSMGMNLPELSSVDDPMFWSNMDSNLFDIFGAVSWETMTGPVGVNASPNTWDMSSFADQGGGIGGNMNDLFESNGQAYL